MSRRMGVTVPADIILKTTNCTNRRTIRAPRRIRQKSRALSATRRRSSPILVENTLTLPLEIAPSSIYTHLFAHFTKYMCILLTFLLARQHLPTGGPVPVRTTDNGLNDERSELEIEEKVLMVLAMC